MNSINTAVKTYRAHNAQFLQVWWAKCCSASAASKSTIEIPNRIHRGPTDILKALEKTVSHDTTGPSFKFFDDPYLVPYHDKQARVYALAKNAGQKAARWVRDEHPELFTQVISDPPVMSYMPSTPINADTVNETILFQKICDAKVTEAIKVYEFMQEKKIDVAEDIKLALLELLCFYNCEDPTPMEHESERYYGQKPFRRNYAVNSWQNHPLVTILFKELQHLGSAPYCALICGLFNAGAKPEGDELLKEAKEKKIQLDVNVYNAWIMRTISVYEKGDVKKEMILDILKDMNSEGVKPNLGTLNAVVDAVSRASFRDKYSTLVKLLNEFNRIGIKPSPGTFGYFARGLLGKTRPDRNLMPFLASTLKSFKGQSLQAKHISDTLFFDWIIKACVVVESLPLAIECLELFLHSKNRTLSDGYKTLTFFNNFFQVLALKGDFETLVKYYKLLVPHAHTANPQFYQVLFEACDMNSAIKDFPGFWRTYMGSGVLNEETINKMLEVGVNLTGLPDPAAEEIKPIIGDLTNTLMVFKLEVDKEKVYERLPLSPEMCNNALILLARGCQWRTLQMSLKYMSEKEMIVEEKVVSKIVDNCHEHNNPNMIVWVLTFCHKNFEPKLELQSVVQKVMQSDFLSKDLKDELKDVLGDGESSSSSSSSSESESSDSDDDSSDSDDISIPRKKKPTVPKIDITKTIN